MTMPNAATDEEIRAALEDAYLTNDFERLHALLTNNEVTSIWSDPCGRLRNVATQCIFVAGNDGDVSKISIIFQIWRENPYFVAPSGEEFNPALALAHGIETLNRDLVNVLLDNGCKVKSIVAEEIADLKVRDGNWAAFTLILQDLVDHGWDVNTKTTPLKGELFWGIYRGPGSQKNLLTLARLATNNLPVFHWLLEPGADPNIADGFDGTPMAYTAMNGTSYMIKQLFQYGAKVDNNALHHVVGRSKMDPERIPILEILLQHGADINALETGLEKLPSSNASALPPHTSTVLYKAVRDRHCQLVRYLLSKGADSEKRTAGFKGQGITPLEWLRLQKWKDEELQVLLEGTQTRTTIRTRNEVS
ncbi:uncharacterized protein PAC_04962 [Phialocephala subalpina]|uniref:Uncharacterized protein n=1 Tax=Phialocephala subalpina TaxID=576137 RepID=A0A1L7WQM8_9HELO|nr:uncharacterized protein PAC_04962 [Phialocephala subalpina]